MLHDVGEEPVSRSLSLFLVAVYVVGGAVKVGPLDAVLAAGICVVPLVCIWFPSALAYPFMRFTMGRNARGTPPGLVWFIGWIWLIGFGVLILLLWLDGAFALSS